MNNSDGRGKFAWFFEKLYHYLLTFREKTIYSHIVDINSLICDELLQLKKMNIDIIRFGLKSE